MVDIGDEGNDLISEIKEKKFGRLDFVGNLRVLKNEIQKFSLLDTSRP
jgi:hypothetical protein